MKRKEIGFLSAGIFFYWFALYTYPSFLTPFMQSLGFSAKITGVVAGSYGFAMLVCRIPLGIWADRVRKRKVFVLAGLLLAAVSCVGMGLAKSAAAMLLFRAMSGVGISAWVCYTVLYHGVCGGEAIANANIIANVGRIAAGFAGAAIAAWAGMRGAFLLGAVAAVLGLVCCLPVRDYAGSGQAATLRELLQVLKSPGVLFAGFLAALFFLMSYATGLMFVSDLATELKATEFQIGLLGTINAAGSLLGLYLVSRVGLKLLSEKLVILLMALLSIAGCFLFPIVENLAALYAVQLLFGFSGGGVTALFMSMAIRAVPPEKQNSAMGAYQALYSLGVLVGPVVMGALVDGVGLHAAFRWISLFGAACILMTILFYDRTQHIKKDKT